MKFQTSYAVIIVICHYDSSRYQDFFYVCAEQETALRTFERFTLEHQGFQALYAETLMSHEEFIKMFPSEMYQKVRASTGCLMK